MPQSGLSEAEIIEASGPEPTGGSIAFYSAQASELAREVNLAQGEEGSDAWYGLFTATVAARLHVNTQMSFRQLFQAVMSDMANGTVAGAAALQTPLSEGLLIDVAVFGRADPVGIRRFAVTADEISAGLVHGIGDGTLVGLVADGIETHLKNRTMTHFAHQDYHDAQRLMRYMPELGSIGLPGVRGADEFSTRGNDMVVDYRINNYGPGRRILVEIAFNWGQ